MTPALELEAVESDVLGEFDATASEAVVKIQFVPSAPFADLIALYPHLGLAAGASLFGAADTPLVLTAANGARLTFAAVAIAQMPELSLTARGPVAGAVTFVARGARDQALTAANRFVAFDTGSIPLAPVRTPQLSDDYSVTWGAAPWANLGTRDGVRVRFAMETRAVMSDANGLLDLTLEKLAVEARFTPASPNGPAESDLIAALELQGTEALPGRSLAATGHTLDIAGGHLFVRLPLAQVTGGVLAFDAAHERVGELMFTAEQAFLGTGAPMALVSLTEGEPF